MALTRIDSYLVDLDSLGGITFDDQAGTPTFKVDATTHRVGIRTSTPTSSLHIAGVGTTDPAGDDNRIRIGDYHWDNRYTTIHAKKLSSEWWLEQNSDDDDGVDLIFYKSRGVPGAETPVQLDDNVFRLTGRVYRQDSTNVGADMTTGDWGGDSLAQIAFDVDEITPTVAYGRIDFRTASQSRMMIKADGNVGIGTTTPSQPLDVVGNINISSGSEYLVAGSQISTANVAEDASYLYYTDARARASVSVTDSGGDGSLSYDSGTGVITYTGPSATEVRSHFSAGTGVSITDGEVAIGQAVGTSDSVSFVGGIFSGNVGIGTDNPTNALHVEGRNFSFGGPGNNFSGEGNLYIGNYNNPQLDPWDRNIRIGSTNEIQIELYTDWDGTQYSDSIIFSSPDGLGWQYNGNKSGVNRSGIYPFYYNAGTAITDDYLFFQAGNKYLWFDADTGRLGINRSTGNGWSDTLDVNGTARVTGIAKFDSNVGIGTTNPAEKLIIYGSGNQWAEIIGVDGTDTTEFSFGTVPGNGAAYFYVDNTGTSSNYEQLTFNVGGNDVVTVKKEFGKTSALLVNTYAHYVDNAALQVAGDGYFNGDVVIDGSNKTLTLPSSTAKIGIGTSDPQTLLHIRSDKPKIRIDSSNPLEASAGVEEIGRIEWEGTKLRADGENNNVAASIRARQDGTWSTITPWNSPTAIEFYTQDSSGTEVTSPRLTIKSGGNVGIGTTNPDVKLHVVGNTNIDGKVIAGDEFQNPNLSNVVDVTQTTNINAYRPLNFIDSSATIKLARVTDTTTSDTALELQTWTADLTTNTSYWDIYGGQNGMALRDRFTGRVSNRLYISLDGNVLIGSAYSNAADSITETTANGVGNIFQVQGNSYFSGQIGIGTTNPQADLVISNGGAEGIELNPNNSGSGINRILSYNRSSGSLGRVDLEIDAADFFITNNASEHFRITDTGNVGIGTTDPSAKLDIHATGSGTELLRFSIEREWAFRQKSSGVGTALSLQSIVGNKYFLIENVDGDTNFAFYAASNETDSTLTVGGSGPRTGSVGIDIQGNGFLSVTTATYTSNINVPYIVAGTSGFDGTTTNWNTYGFQHRLKSNSGGTPRVTIDGANGEYFCVANTGNVGIGINDPISKLHVSGDIRLESTAPHIRFIETDAASDNKHWINTVNSESLYWQAINDTGVGGGNLFKMTRSANNIQTFEGTKAGNTWVKLDNNSKILEVIDQGHAQVNKPSNYWQQNSYYGLDDGTNPLGSLTHMGGFETVLTSNGYRTSTSGQWKGFAANSNTGAAAIQLAPSGVIKFGTQSNKVDGESHVVTQRMMIDENGNVGIGTDNPTQKLEVAGRVILDELEWGNNYVVKEYVTGYSASYINDGNVEIIKLGEFNFTGSSQNIFGTGELTSSSGANFGTVKFEFGIRKSGAADPPSVVGKQIVTYYSYNPSVFFYQDSNDVNKLIMAAKAHDATAGIHQMYWKILLHERSDYNFYTNESSFVTITNTSNYTLKSLNTLYSSSLSYFDNISISADAGNALTTVAESGNPNVAFAAIHADLTNTNDVARFDSYRSATSAFEFLRCRSSSNATTPDIEFKLLGDGNAYADNAWTGGGADYAEYFEWFDGNPSEEDRRGISVVLEGDKIREALSGEEPIGIISGNPSVVGDAAWNKWNGKYLRDKFGTYILEDYNVINSDGETVTQQRRKLNPNYDPNIEYVPREQRSEWDCVGLMGKIRVLKGQVTGSRWIKMRDIDDSVEEWLVR